MYRKGQIDKSEGYFRKRVPMLWWLFVYQNFIKEKKISCGKFLWKENFTSVNVNLTLDTFWEGVKSVNSVNLSDLIGPIKSIKI